MLGDLIAEINSLKINSLSLIKNLPIVELNDLQQRNFEKFFREKQKMPCICNSHSFQVETSESHWAICSNQYLAMAAVGHNFAMCLKNYFDFFDQFIRPNKKESDTIVDLQAAYPKASFSNLNSIDLWLKSHFCTPYTNHVTAHPEDKDSLCYFLAGIGTKKFGNDKKILRGTPDLFSAYILAIEPVTTAASGFLGTLVYFLCQDTNEYDEILECFNTAKSNCQHKDVVSPSQIIYYGVPGSGKSNKIKELLKNVPDERKERVVFHPEYTNADFVGQILPVVHDGVDYKFTPGPFTKMVAKAYKSLASENPEQFYLVIEEINRGNAAAIFGDVFQLLDRIKPGETDSSLGNNSTYTEWWSQYFVYNEDINSKILEIVGASELKMGSVIFTKDSGIRLPPNLNILATMNTSDQNVFTLDNAFQRRFDMELVRNEFEKGDVNGFKDAAIRDQHDACIEGTDCTWGDFWEKINAKIVSLNRGLASTEDKRLGPWFVRSVAGDSAATPRKIPAKVFAEKVLKYLWDDAFKFKRPQVFAEGLTSLEQVVKKFEEAPAGNLEKLKAIFKEY